MKSDQYHIVGVRARIRLVGFEERFPEGFLPKLESALNAQEVFESSQSAPRRYLALDGENWAVEVEPGSLKVAGWGFRDSGSLREGVSFFLEQLREAAAPFDEHIYFWASAVEATAEWTMEPKALRGRTTGQIINSKALKLKPEQIDHLPGDVLGAGISLVLRPEGYLYTLELGPTKPDTLRPTIELIFPEPEPSKWPTNDIEAVTENIERTYDLLENDIKAFIDAVMLPANKGDEG